MTNKSDIVPILGIPEERLASFLLFIAPAFFCTNMLVAKATADIVPPIALAFMRWGGTFLLLLPLVGPRLWARRQAIRREWLDLLVLGALGMGVCGAFVYIGADTTTATNIGLIYSTAPVFITLLAWIVYGEAATGRQMIGIVISLCGVMVIICRGDVTVLTGFAFTAGDIWIVTSMIAWAVYSVLLRHRPSEMGISTRFGAIVMAGIIVLAPFTFWESVVLGDVPAFTLETFGWVALLACVASFGAYQVYAFVQKTLGAGRTGLLLYLMPVYNVFLAWALLGEQPQIYHWIGAAMVLPGLMLATGGRKQQA